MTMSRVDAWLTRIADADVCDLTTSGRRSGRPHTIEIWFAVHDDRLYFLAGGRDRSDWVRNVRANGAARIQVGDESRDGRGRVIDDPAEDALARRLLAAKYQGWRDGQPLSEWARTALPIVVELTEV